MLMSSDHQEEHLALKYPVAMVFVDLYLEAFLKIQQKLVKFITGLTG